ncbi:TetR family transcriptional regulator [Mycolicibacterium madagascariense]|uniref:TetR family transcriptional regulator n=1 Tax=Mycolicibacterium madagascariense TaxID=212765 RepID=A0A7I7XLZ9_9MYCO|nr:TetR/AcrR family transcriptional regulator [Mycolicibacterium madagascariense]MCV7012563.1 TetR/AcrR family transcriptional regulator [Mycolicibacterium madagascariense]BBZ30244.1 TetR family transcriptional regulator [Mycolicibacterium madagascariense]
MARPTAPRGAARGRVLEAALALFAEHGVHGTSLQMIADRIGVSKAAVYYQFHSKEDIALEVIRPSMEDAARVIRIAEALPDPRQRRAVAVSGLVEMAVRNRQLAVMFYKDPAIDQLVLNDADLKAISVGLRELLDGPDPDVAHRVASSVFFAGIGKAATDPELADVEDAELRGALLDVSGRILAPLEEPAAG